MKVKGKLKWLIPVLIALVASALVVMTIYRKDRMINDPKIATIEGHLESVIINENGGVEDEVILRLREYNVTMFLYKYLSADELAAIKKAQTDQALVKIGYDGHEKPLKISDMGEVRVITMHVNDQEIYTLSSLASSYRNELITYYLWLTILEAVLVLLAFFAGRETGLQVQGKAKKEALQKRFKLMIALMCVSVAAGVGFIVLLRHMPLLMALVTYLFMVIIPAEVYFESQTYAMMSS